LWLVNYKPEFRHPFILRKDLELPARTVIRGIPAGASVACCRMCRNASATAEDHGVHTN